MKRVFTSGCWDLIHPGHIAALEYARAQGDHLTVSIASDWTIRGLKREPVLCEHDRFIMISALRCVDACFVARGAGRQDCFAYVRSLRPDVWVVDADDPIREEKQALALEVGAELVFNYRPNAGPSTTNLIEPRTPRCADSAPEAL